MLEQSSAGARAFVFLILLVLSIFMLDWLAPLGLAVWALYVIPIVLAYHVVLPASRAHIIPLLCAVLTTAGLFLSAPHTMPWIAATNRAVGLVAFFVLSYMLQTRRSALWGLLESEGRFRQLAESLPQLVWTCTADGSCDYLSPQWIAFTGVPEAEQLGYGWVRQLHPDDREPVVTRWNQAFPVGHIFDVQFRIRRYDGVYHWFRTKAVPLRDHRDRLVKWFGTNTDIDDLKQTEQELRQANEGLDAQVLRRTGELRQTIEALRQELDAHNRAELALEERARLATFAAEVSYALSHEGTVPVFLQRITDLAANHLHAALARIWVIRPGDLCSTCHKANWCMNQTECLHLQASAGLSTNLNGEYRRVPLGTLKIGCIAQGDGGMVTNDALGDDRLSNKRWLVQNGLTSFAGFPLVVENRIYGVLAIFARDPLTQPVVQALESACGAVATTIARKRIEESLGESQARFSSAFRDATIGMALVGIDGRWLEVNPALCELVGYKEDELLATTFQAITHPDDLDADLAFVRRMLAGEIRTYQMEKRYFHKKGHSVWILLSVSLVLDAGGRPHYFISQIQDINERKRITEELRESESRLQAILENSSNMVFLKDLDGRYLLVNRQFERAFHLTREAILGKTDHEIFPPQQAATFRDNDRQVLAEDKLLQFEEVALHDDGPHTSIVSKFPLRTPNGQPYAVGGITTDITDRKRTEAALRDSERQLAVAFAEREALSRDLHDSIVQSLFGLSMSLEECQALLNEDLAEARSRLATETENVRQLIQEVRRYLIIPSFTIIDPKDFLSELQTLSRQAHDRRHCHIRLNLQDLAVHRLTNHQATHFSFIVREAVSNAIVHGEAKHCIIALESLEEGLRLVIEDDGSGFEPAAANSKGHGLRNIRDRAEQLGAHIAIRSKPRGGTTVALTIR